MSSFIAEITDNLYVGNFSAALDPGIITEKNISFVVNCTKTNKKVSPFMDYIQIPLDEPPTPVDLTYIKQNFVYFIPIINSALGQGRSVLVHCDDCTQRAPLIAVIYLMTKYGFTLNNAIFFVQNKVPQAFKNSVEYLEPLSYIEKLENMAKNVNQNKNMVPQNNYNNYNDYEEKPKKKKKKKHHVPENVQHIEEKKRHPVKLHNFIIFDKNDAFLEEAKRLEQYGIDVVKDEVESLVYDYKIHALVSPANSFGDMRGGIDKSYTEMFPNIQRKAQARIKDFGLRTNAGRNYLPIGSAVTIPTENTKCPFLVISPTMFMPGSIKDTDNVFYAFLSLIYIAKKNKNCVIACPGLGTGIGKLDAKYAVDQMETALLEYNDITKGFAYQNQILYNDPINIVLKQIPCQQPRGFAGSEMPM